uniref:SANT domain-containing protein n=1 Tax=Parastrongyloides trichosuri TaxID=131310 RepID=A0A0N4ZZ40_PARTI
MVKKKNVDLGKQSLPQTVVVSGGVVEDTSNIRRSSRTRRATATILTSDLSLPSFNSPSARKDSVSLSEDNPPAVKKRRVSESVTKRNKKKSVCFSPTLKESNELYEINEEINKNIKPETSVFHEALEAITQNVSDTTSTKSETGRGKRMRKPKKFADEEIIESPSRRKSMSKPKQPGSIKIETNTEDEVTSNDKDLDESIDSSNKNKVTDQVIEDENKISMLKKKLTKSKGKIITDNERELNMVESADYNILSSTTKIGKLNFSNGFSILDRLNTVSQMKIQRETEKRLEILRKEQEKKERAEKRKQEIQKKRNEQKLLSLQAQNAYFPGFNFFMPNSVEMSHDNTPDPDFSMDELFVTNSGRVVKNRNNYLRDRYDQCLFVDDKNTDLTYDPNYEEEKKKKRKEVKPKLYEQSTISRKFFGRGISSFIPQEEDDNETTSQEGTDEDESSEKHDSPTLEIVKSTSTPTEDGFVINIDDKQKTRRIKFVVNRYKMHLINNKELRESVNIDVRLKLRESRLPFKSKFKAVELGNREWPGNYNVGILINNEENDEINEDDFVIVDDIYDNSLCQSTTYDAFIKEIPGNQVVRDIRQIEEGENIYDNCLLDNKIDEVEKSDLKYMLEKGLFIIKEQFYSERTYLNVDNSASVFHVFSRRNADLLIHYMSPYNKESKELCHKAHMWFMKYLPDDLLAAYLNILRFAKTYGYKISDILKENHENNSINKKHEEIRKCVKDFINVKAVDPWFKEARDALPTNFTNVTCFIVLPNISTYDYYAVNVMYKELMENFIPSIASHSEFVNLSFTTPEPVSVAELMEHCIDKIKIQLQNLLISRPNDHIITVGWGVTNAIIHRVLTEIGGISASINLAYCNKTSDGIIGDVDHELTLSYCPQLFIVGEDSTTFDLKSFNITRQTMTSESGLVVIGNADSNLRVSANTLIRERVTQSSVNLIITEVLKDFIESVTPFDDIPIKEFRKIMQPTDMDLHLDVDCQLLKENHTILYSAQALKKANESKATKNNLKIESTRPESPITPLVKNVPVVHQPLVIHKTISTNKPSIINTVPSGTISSYSNKLEPQLNETTITEGRNKNEGEASFNNSSAIDLDDLEIGGFGSFF